MRVKTLQLGLMFRVGAQLALALTLYFETWVLLRKKSKRTLTTEILHKFAVALLPGTRSWKAIGAYYLGISGYSSLQTQRPPPI
ncbi:hypothetical protein WG66_014716 [Moniliophthora roreri]|nr:hypothetical protein WG66_014716 [Moniliophthora roreri]